MNPESSPPLFSAPCVIDQGILVNKADMQRALGDLGQVDYFYHLEGQCQGSGRGWILDVFSDTYQATLVMNHTLYLNVNSFDYLQLTVDDQGKTLVDLWQDSRQLRLIPLDGDRPWIDMPLGTGEIDLEWVVSEVLSAHWDMEKEQENP